MIDCEISLGVPVRLSGGASVAVVLRFPGQRDAIRDVACGFPDLGAAEWRVVAALIVRAGRLRDELEAPHEPAAT